MSGPRAEDAWKVGPAEGGVALAAFLRARCPGTSWRALKAAILRGEFRVGEDVEADPGRRLEPGASVRRGPPSATPRTWKARGELLHVDTHVVVIDKPADLSSVPFEADERDTALHRTRDALVRAGVARPGAPLLVVHRIDRGTSGLLVFARTKLAERALQQQFRAHSVERLYLCVAHGDVAPQRIESELVEDRGDGLRGSATPRQRALARGRPAGKRAVTHVRPVRLLRGATLCEVRLETGKTHQIRIHLSERGHALVGDPVYTRDMLRRGETPLRSPRLLLHAATLGFTHPQSGERLRFESPLPADFRAALAALS